jgi:uncharacterized membrane protein
MFHLPPMPSWDGLHPLIVHFPIGLLLVVPIFLLSAIFLKQDRGRAFLISALLLLAIGTFSVFIAVRTGEAAGKLADRSPQINAVLEHHEELAESTRFLFGSLTLLLAAVLVVPRFLRRPEPRAAYVSSLVVYLLLYSMSIPSLVNTAHNGGRLVHEFGVHSLIAPTNTGHASADTGDGE